MGTEPAPACKPGFGFQNPENVDRVALPALKDPVVELAATICLWEYQHHEGAAGVATNTRSFVLFLPLLATWVRALKFIVRPFFLRVPGEAQQC